MYSTKEQGPTAAAPPSQGRLPAGLHHCALPPPHRAHTSSSNYRTTAPHSGSSRIVSSLTTGPPGYRRPSLSPQKHDIPAHVPLECHWQTPVESGRSDSFSPASP